MVRLMDADIRGAFNLLVVLAIIGFTTATIALLVGAGFLGRYILQLLGV